MSLALYEDGKRVRCLEYCAEEGGWLRDEGNPAPFEDSRKLRAWRRRRILAVPNGYDVLKDFLGDTGRNTSRQQELEGLATEHDPFAGAVSRAVGWLREEARTHDVYAAAFVLEKDVLELRLGTEETRQKRLKKALAKDRLLRESTQAGLDAFRWSFRGWAPTLRVAEGATRHLLEARLVRLTQGAKLPRIAIFLEESSAGPALDPKTTPRIAGPEPKFFGKRQFAGASARTVANAFERALEEGAPEWSTGFFRAFNEYVDAHPKPLAEELIARAAKLPARANELLEPLLWSAEAADYIRTKPKLVAQVRKIAGDAPFSTAGQLLNAVSSYGAE